MRAEFTPADGRPHGSHTLRVWEGVVVGVHADDVFVQLGPRMQGVISARAFEVRPEEGDHHRFTLRGKEESLWALALADERSLATWEDAEPGLVVTARVMRAVDGGLQLKVGPLHAFMPRSQTGLPRGKKVDPLVGKSLVVEVIEVDPERQRVIVSRRPVIERERKGSRIASRVEAGQIVQGRVSRIEDFGAFVSFGRGHEGLIHVSNISHERVDHPSEVLEVGQAIEAKILHVRRGGKRIGLGLKQLGENPWRALERQAYEGQLLEGTVTRVTEFGAFVALRPGVEVLLPNSETGSDLPARSLVGRGRRLCVRLVSLDPDAERGTVSMLHVDGSPVEPEEARTVTEFAEFQKSRADQGGVGTRLGPLLAKALGGGRRGGEAAGAAS